MQVEFDDIASSKRLLRQIREEEFVDDARTRDAYRTLLVGSRMRCHDHAVPRALGSHRYLRTVVETANHLAFRALLELIGRQVQSRLDLRMIEGGVLFAAGHKGEPGQISEHSSCPILAVEPEQGSPLRELVCCEVAHDGGESLSQFLPVAPVAFVPKTAEPLEAVRLADDGPSSYDLPTLAARWPGHTPHPIGERMGAGLRSEARRVAGRPHVSHQAQRSPRRLPLDRPDPRFASPA